MTVTGIARMWAKEGRGDEFQAAVQANLHLITDDPGSQGVQVLRQIEDPDAFVFHIHWTSIEAHHRWQASDAIDAWRDATFPFRNTDRSGELAHYDVAIESGPSEPPAT